MSLKIAGTTRCCRALPLLYIFSMPCFLPHWLSPCSHNHLLFSPSPQPSRSPHHHLLLPPFFPPRSLLKMLASFHPAQSCRFILVLCLLAQQSVHGGCHPPLTPLPPSTFHWPESFSSWSSPPFSFDHFFPPGRSVPASADLCTLLLFIYLLALSVHPSLHPRSFSRGIFSTFSASLLGFISGGVRGLSWRGCAGVTATVQL